MRDAPFRPRRRDVLAAGCAAAVMAALPAAARAPAILRRAPATQSVEGAAFGTGWRVTLPAGADGARLTPAIDALLAGIDRRLSPWRPDSEIGRFNAAPAGRHAVSAETAAVAAAGLVVAQESGGAFDPAVGPLVARWGFGPIDGAAGAWQALSADGGSLAKAEDGLTLDLCGIAKGHALDRLGALLEARGEGDFLADLGGELMARGRHPEGRPWRVGVEDPRKGAPGLAETLPLEHAAIATSGRLPNGFAYGGRDYSHIIDPGTGAPVAGHLASVSVLSGDAMAADAWATACMAAGAGGPDLARARGLRALFLFRTGTGLRRVATGGFGAAPG